MISLDKYRRWKIKERMDIRNLVDVEFTSSLLHGT